MKLILLQLNEVPFKLFNLYINNAEIIKSNDINFKVYKSLVTDEDDESDLFPASTWGSLNYGVSKSDHGIHWYNDKVFFKSIYDEIISSNKTGNFVNVLNTDSLIDNKFFSNIDLFIPSSFSQLNSATPKKYQNLFLSNKLLININSRKSSILKSIIIFLKYNLFSFIFFKIIFLNKTFLLNYLTKIIKGNFESIRDIQFLIYATIFKNHLSDNINDINVLFTNHVAANMHRYWYAAFPEDFKTELYDDIWIKKNKNMIKDSFEIINFCIVDLIKLIKNKNIGLIILSSMGQKADLSINSIISQNYGFKLNSFRKFINFLGLERYNIIHRTEMIPQISIEFIDNNIDNESVKNIINKLTKYFENELNVSYSFKNCILTINFNKISINNFIKAKFEKIGFSTFKVADHRSGTHQFEGVIACYGFNSDKYFRDSMPTTEIKDSILKLVMV